MAFGLSEGRGQHFVSSHGEAYQWSLPYEVYYRIQHDFYRHDVVHVARVSTYRRAFYDVVLRRGGMFIKVRMTPYGKVIYRERNFPFDYRRHQCQRSCGFDQRFYRDAVCRPVRHEGHFYRDDIRRDAHGYRNSNHAKSRLHARSRGHDHHHAYKAYPSKRSCDD